MTATMASTVSCRLVRPSSSPANWRTRTFGGLRFSTPARGPSPTSRATPAAPTPSPHASSGCRTPTASTCLPAPRHRPPPDTTPPGRVSSSSPAATCPDPPPTPPVAPGPACASASTRPPTSGGLQPGHELSLLTAQVYLPGQRRPDQIEIGLAGSGLQAAQIFDSIAPARAGSAAAGSRATVAQVHHFVTTLEPNDLRGHLVGDRLHPDRARTCNRDRRRPARQMVLPGHPGRRLPGGHRPRTRGRVFDQELRRVRRPRVRELR